jgi:hypothetical protein
LWFLNNISVFIPFLPLLDFIKKQYAVAVCCVQAKQHRPNTSDIDLEKSYLAGINKLPEEYKYSSALFYDIMTNNRGFLSH